MTVKQMLTEMDSKEYARWIAFERTNGPIGGYQMQQEALSSMHEQLQLIAYVLSQANFASEDHPEGPVPKPQRYPRPYDQPEEKLELIIDNSDEWLTPQEGTCPPDCECNGGTRRPTSHF